VLDPHESAVASPKQKLCINKSAEQRVAGGCIEPPESASLRQGETQPGHFEKFTLYALERFFGRSRRLWRHIKSSDFGSCQGGTFQGATDVPPADSSAPVGIESTLAEFHEFSRYASAATEMGEPIEAQQLFDP